MKTIKQLFNYYLAHQDELVKDYNGKYIVLSDNKVVGAFDSTDDAYEYGVANCGPGRFILQLCTPGPEAYTQTYTRAIFW